MSRSLHVVDLQTKTENHVIAVDVAFFDSGRKEYVVSIHDTEIGPQTRSVLFDFAVPSCVPVETVARFNAKRLAFHAANWKNVPGVMELITKILKVRGLSLAEEAKAITGITEPTVKTEVDEPEETED